MKNKTKITSIFVFIFLTGYLHAQVKIDNTIEFNSSDSLKNSISGLGFPTDYYNAIQTENVLYTQIINANCSFTSDTFNLSIFSDTDSLKIGSWVVFKACDTSRGNTYFEINNFGFFPVYNANGLPLLPGEIVSGMEVIALFTGNLFVIGGNEVSKCPPGFKDVNNEYCIQIEEQAPALFWQAVDYCYSQNARLCNWSEWYYACLNDGNLGLNNMRTNYEFVDDAGDHASNIVYMGSGNCTNQNNLSTLLSGATYQKNYRCCYDKK